jgi:hypothetical protein
MDHRTTSDRYDGAKRTPSVRFFVRLNDGNWRVSPMSIRTETDGPERTASIRFGATIGYRERVHLALFTGPGQGNPLTKVALQQQEDD